MARLIDLTQTVQDNLPVFPGDPETHLFQVNSLEADGYNNYRMETGMHTGTHIDGPMHLTESREYISDLPLESLTGPGCLLEAADQPLITLTPDRREKVKENSIVLIYTGQSRLYGSPEYFTGYPLMDKCLAEFLVKCKIKMVGFDSPSPDVSPYPVHKLLLENGIYIIENLTGLEILRGLTRFEIIALPLKIQADGAPARVIARIP